VKNQYDYALAPFIYLYVILQPKFLY